MRVWPGRFLGDPGGARRARTLAAGSADLNPYTADIPALFRVLARSGRLAGREGIGEPVGGVGE